MVIMEKVTIGTESSSDEKEIDSENEHNTEESANDKNENSDDNNESSDDESNHDSIDQTKEMRSMNLNWADSMQKILKSSKPKSKKTLVLSRAKKLTDQKKNESKPALSFEIVGEIKNEKLETEKSLVIKEDPAEPPKKKIKSLCTERIKPDILDKDREKTLSKIATKGVVQLFNAVRMQQKEIGQKLEEAGPLERKRDQVLKNIDKRSFLDILMSSKSQQVDSPVKEDEDNKNIEILKLKTDDEEEDTKRSKSPTWNILRDDFMMGGKLKDWDKNVSDEEVSSSQEIQLSNSD